MGDVSPHPPEYVAARRTLLDALDALTDHRDSLVLIGSQAIYLHTGPADLTVPPTTTDADLALDADLLAKTPEIGQALERAGFSAKDNPGHWVNDLSISVDLMVPPHKSGRTKRDARSAHLPPHDERTARIGPGLALALIDNDVRNLASLDPADARIQTIRVANPTALLVAKTIKVMDRLEDANGGRPRRIVEKDALDILRLLQTTPTRVFASTLAVISAGTPAYEDAERAMGDLRQLAAKPEDPLPLMAQAAAGDDPTAAASLAYLTYDLMLALA